MSPGFPFGWRSNITFYIRHTGNITLRNYTVRAVIVKADHPGLFNNSGIDFRVADLSSFALLPFWIRDAGSLLIVDVRVPEILSVREFRGRNLRKRRIQSTNPFLLAGNNITLVLALFYGNPLAPPAPTNLLSGSNVFDFFVDFSTDSTLLSPSQASYLSSGALEIVDPLDSVLGGISFTSTTGFSTLSATQSSYQFSFIRNSIDESSGGRHEVGVVFDNIDDSRMTYVFEYSPGDDCRTSKLHADCFSRGFSIGIDNCDCQPSASYQGLTLPAATTVEIAVRVEIDRANLTNSRATVLIDDLVAQTMYLPPSLITAGFDQIFVYINANAYTTDGHTASASASYDYITVRPYVFPEPAVVFELSSLDTSNPPPPNPPPPAPRPNPGGYTLSPGASEASTGLVSAGVTVAAIGGIFIATISLATIFSSSLASLANAMNNGKDINSSTAIDAVEENPVAVVGLAASLAALASSQNAVKQQETTLQLLWKLLHQMQTIALTSFFSVNFSDDVISMSKNFQFTLFIIPGFLLDRDEGATADESGVQRRHLLSVDQVAASVLLPNPSNLFIQQIVVFAFFVAVIAGAYLLCSMIAFLFGKSSDETRTRLSDFVKSAYLRLFLLGLPALTLTSTNQLAYVSSHPETRNDADVSLATTLAVFVILLCCALPLLSLWVVRRYVTSSSFREDKSTKRIYGALYNDFKKSQLLYRTLSFGSILLIASVLSCILLGSGAVAAAQTAVFIILGVALTMWQHNVLPYEEYIVEHISFVQNGAQIVSTFVVIGIGSSPHPSYLRDCLSYILLAVQFLIFAYSLLFYLYCLLVTVKTWYRLALRIKSKKAKTEIALSDVPPSRSGVNNTDG